MAFEPILERIQGLRRSGKGWIGLCPSHKDGRPSLSVTINDGKLLFQCFKGCQFTDIIKAMDVKPTDCFLDEPTSQQPIREVARYKYTDEEGRHLYSVVRLEPKDFRIQAADGRWGLNGARKVLYNLPAVRNAPERILLIVEGEKSADRLAQAGFLATCSPGGAGKWNSSYTEDLAGRHDVIILPDNDEPGMAHARDVLNSISRHVRKARLLVLDELPPKGDVVDWLVRHTPSDLKVRCNGVLAADQEQVLKIVGHMPTCERWRLIHRLLEDLEQ